MALGVICAGSALICILLLAGTCSSILLPGGADHWAEVHRARRHTNESEAEDANTKCVIRNLKEIESKLEKALPPEKNVSKAAALAKPHQIFSNADPNTLVKFCAIYKASRTRLAGCGESQMRSFAAKALAVVDFVCVDRYEDFSSAFPCIQKVDKILDAECQKNCSEYKDAAEKLNSAGATIVKKYSPREIKELFAQSCLYVSCFTGCQKPLLEKECGPKVMELEMSSVGVTFKNLDDMMMHSSASNLWPQECRPLSSMGAHERESSAPAVSAAQPTAGNASSHDNATRTSESAVGAPAISASSPVPPATNSSASLNTTVVLLNRAPSAKVTPHPPVTSNSTSLPLTVSVLPVGNSTTSRRLRSRTMRKF